ncbi:hypothetical protein [Solibacillus sp. FSL K6-1523]|uniref:hypothetical protein n=1 Tax=Solibacillus sp. FSL K6-1523 TaxID=2921471 RepID=UPI0030F6AB2D
MDEENPTSPNVPETDNSAAVEQQPAAPAPDETQQPAESEKNDGTSESPEVETPSTEPPPKVEVGDVESDGTSKVPEELPEIDFELVEEIKTKSDPFLELVPEDPQLYATNYTTDDYVITLVHEMTLGDVLIATLLSVLIVVVVLKAVLGGGRSW